MNREELVAASKAYFESHPKEEVFFATSDGMFFTTQSRSDAASHARNLGCELETISRNKIMENGEWKMENSPKITKKQKLSEAKVEAETETKTKAEAEKAEAETKQV